MTPTTPVTIHPRALTPRGITAPTGPSPSMVRSSASVRSAAGSVSRLAMTGSATATSTGAGPVASSRAGAASCARSCSASGPGEPSRDCSGDCSGDSALGVVTPRV